MTAESPASPDALAVLRTRIDALDAQLLALLNQRAGLAEEIGRIKRQEGTPFFRPDRVGQVLKKLQRANPGPIRDAHLAAIWREIMSACLALEVPQCIAVLGPEGTFTEQAGLVYFGSAATFVYCQNVDEVFHATEAGTSQYGVVAVENSTEGVVTRSFDLFLQSPVHIIGEVSLMVRHNLLRQMPGLDGIQAVVAHPQALMQCHGWLAQHLPDAERRAVSSNAEGARLAAENPRYAAIASERAAARFSLHIAAHAILYEAYNRTRFAVICLPQTLATPAPTGNDCTSIVVSVPNKPGSVHDMLMPLKEYGVSMTRFESRPAKSGQWEYYFFIDISGHPAEPNVHAALEKLRATCAFYKVLGAYPVGRDV
jgi:chorismate mutase/prephenate dehydratase